jgi:hypothetical protein
MQMSPLIYTDVFNVAPAALGKEPLFFAPFETKKTIILPIQARDQHRETNHSKKERGVCFLTGKYLALPPALNALGAPVIAKVRRAIHS